MTKNLEKLPFRILVIYRNGEYTNTLIGTGLALETEGRFKSLSLDLTNNFKVQNKKLACYKDACELLQLKERIKHIQFVNDVIEIDEMGLDKKNEDKNFWRINIKVENDTFIYSAKIVEYKGSFYFEIKDMIDEEERFSMYGT